MKERGCSQWVRFFQHMKTKLAVLMILAAGSLLAEPIELVRKSLPFVKEKGLAWIEDRQCASCHQVPSMLWSLNSAARAGLETGMLETTKWTPWAADWRHWNQTGEKDGVDKVSAGNIETMVFLCKRHSNDRGIELGEGRVGSQGCPTLWTADSRF